MTRKSRVTLKDVAAAADVSIVTASIAISGRMGNAHLSVECIQRVRAAAQKLGYQQNYLASALRSGRSSTIGLSVGNQGFSMAGHRFWGPIAGGAETTVRQRGYDLLMIHGSETVLPVERGLRFLNSQRIDGLIVPQDIYGNIPPEIDDCTLPLVLLMGRPRPNMSQVTFDATPGVRDAVAHLSALGHQRAAYIGRLTYGYFRQRADEFQAACRNQGIDAQLVELPVPAHGHSVKMGSLVASLMNDLRAVELPRDVTAMMCMNDGLALAMLHILQERGLRCPQDVSVVGFDDMYPDSNPSLLTTISHRLEDLGAACANLLISLIDSPANERTVQTVTLESRLVVGGTTGPAKS